MSIHTTSSAQRRIAQQQLLHVIRAQNIRQRATILRQQALIAEMERDLIDAAISAHDTRAVERQACNGD